MKNIYLISILLYFSAGFAHADYSSTWCIGERSARCPVSPAYACPSDGGPGGVDVAKSICTIHSSAGDKLLDFRIKVVSSIGGDRCGYTVYEVTCITGD